MAGFGESYAYMTNIWKEAPSLGIA